MNPNCQKLSRMFSVLIKSKRDYKKKQALVTWKRYSDEFNCWIPFKD